MTTDEILNMVDAYGSCLKQASDSLGALVFRANIEHALRKRDEQEAAIGAGGVERLRSGGAPEGLGDANLEDLAHSANQEALSFGLSPDVFARYFKQVRDRAQGAQAVASVEVCAVCGDGQAHLVRFCDTCGSEYAGVAETRRAQAVAEPEMTDALRGYIRGMSVSVDVSTGDHDAGNRYFGTVTEVMDCFEDKNGVTLLVQEAEPNFEALPTPKAEPMPTPKGFALVPLRPTREMERVMQEESWEWEELLAAANAITEEQHDWIARGCPEAQPAVEPVAHRIMRRRPDGEWVNDGRYWSDGAPSADLAASIPSLGDGWRIDYAYASPAPAPNALDAETAFLQETDQYLLHRFIETSEDDESYDISKDEVKRLANLGVLESCGFGRYGVTMFGYWAHERFWHQNPSLPLKTNADRDREKRAAISAQSAQGG